MSIKGQGHSFTLVKVHSDFKVKCLTFGLYTQVSDSGPLGPLVVVFRGQYESAKIKIPKYFPISVKESSLEAMSVFAAVTSSFPLPC